MMRPKLLDLFCCAGGGALGYHAAGFEVVGVDCDRQPNYPFGFHQADALTYLAEHGSEFDAIHASPPCQPYSVGRHIHRSGMRHPDLVGTARLLLLELGKPFIIENVVGSPLSQPFMLCGLMFGLRVLRHRLFESSEMILVPSHPKHPRGNLTNSCQGYSTGETGFVCVAGHNFVRTAGLRAMGIGNQAMTRMEVAQAIPPAYTKFIGRQLLSFVQGGNVVESCVPMAGN